MGLRDKSTTIFLLEERLIRHWMMTAGFRPESARNSHFLIGILVCEKSSDKWIDRGFGVSTMTIVTLFRAR
jgi:hypothetical protein